MEFYLRVQDTFYKCSVLSLCTEYERIHIWPRCESCEGLPSKVERQKFLWRVQSSNLRDRATRASQRASPPGISPKFSVDADARHHKLYSYGHRQPGASRFGKSASRRPQAAPPQGSTLSMRSSWRPPVARSFREMIAGPTQGSRASPHLSVPQRSRVRQALPRRAGVAFLDSGS